MPQNLPTALDSLRASLLDADRLVRAVASGRRRSATPRFRRTELRWVDLRAGRRLQVVTYDEQQSFTRNVAADEAGAAVDEVLAEPYGNWHIDTTDEEIQLRVTKKGDAQVHRAGRTGGVDRSHDRRKARMLEPDDPFLAEVGISGPDGRVKPSRSAKYRQVDEFLRAFAPVLDRAHEEAGSAPLRVTDLGCGNAYLTFGAHAWLDRQPDLKINVTGVDVKEQSRTRNEELAERLGWSSTMAFVREPIASVELDQRPHVVFALHACDTATDDALARAVRWDAPVILAAPCCHHDLQRRIGRATSWPQPYGLLARHGILRERFADVLTDAFRATVLRILGYRVEVIEFVDSAHTPRNTLLRAVRTGGAPDPATIAEYRRMTDEWNVEPALVPRLRQELDTRMK
ncbi:methyltransferase family protein [Haloactinopolyspora alba]|uniref:Methyltransferase family protein n=1 Tax=Haloactinopolyspora alba TaxID=648780 RepID=A0A2P8DM36_9ACTN|nr:SAM-dependent methyltransferase [Haloactinopolyspora alba]PSK98245.1 methyltransferase family protein [Haloactinopolyspora alba]